MIPKIVHQIWIQGKKSLPEDLLEKHDLIKNSNPDYQVLLWDDQSIRNLLSNKYPQLLNLYLNVENIPGPINLFASKSDIARYVILCEYGGFYIDLDFYCKINLQELVGDNTNMIFADNTYNIMKPLRYFTYTPMYNMAFCAFQPKHMIWENIFERIMNAKNRVDIGCAVDKFLQESNIKAIRFPNNVVSTHTSCNVNLDCYTSPQSSWFKFRPLLCNISCYIQLWILLFILLIFISLIVHFKSK